MSHLFQNLLHFCRLLRRLGLDVPSARLLDVVRALEHVGIERPSDFYHALRTILVRRQEDLAVFDEAFALFWRARGSSPAATSLRALGENLQRASPRMDVVLHGGYAAPGGPEAATGDDDTTIVERIRTYSPHEVLRQKDFARYTAGEIAEARALMAEWTWHLGVRRTRRWTPGRGRVADLRRVMRRNLKYGGEVVELPRRERKEKPRPLVVICDVSGSMERYTRMLLHFLHALAAGRERVEAFLFATRLTRITGHLTRGRVDETVAAIARSVPDWAGGTRIGDALRTFNVQWGRRVLGQAPVVLVISDGWDRGDPALLRDEMARLQRSCYRLVWLNPLLGSPGYEPLTRGMQAALPFVDDFLPAHNLASLDALARYLGALPPRRGARRQQIQRVHSSTFT